MERRLAAILATDVVGYSRLIREDEAGTLADAGVPVMRQVGMCPHFVNSYGGFKLQGRRNSRHSDAAAGAGTGGGGALKLAGAETFASRNTTSRRRDVYEP